MPRTLCVGNGNLQVNIDDNLNIRDMLFPFVGLENQSVVISAGSESGWMDGFPG
ncbi:MAG: hypothetical protein JSW72_01790 [Candidatus Bathyarchaeota archaeon]|nr:MAG: hypothetical protein JSW72_01790 [Candidatus Bathyarchaeota archaeon]